MTQGKARIEHARQARRRQGVVVRWLLVLVFLGLGFALFRVQVLGREAYALQARENRLRGVTIRAPRGTVYDRHGRVIAENGVSHEVLLMPADREAMAGTLEDLRPLLGLTDADIDAAWRGFRRSPGLPMVVDGDASAAIAARVEERRGNLREVIVRPYPKREYPAARASSPLIGYVAEISERELQSPDFDGYAQGRWIGKAGIERQYEPVLSGTPGRRYLEVDAKGRIRRWMPSEVGTASVPGNDLQLHLDLDLQEYVAEIFNDVRMHADLAGMDTVRGAFVALDPRTGGVLAYYSTPAFDPNLFVGGVRSDVWERLNADPTRPLMDRVAGSGAPQPPGSTFKLVLAAMALEEGIITPASHMPEPCTGGLWFQGRYAKCWCDGCYWDFDLVQAIQKSCNVYFYQLGIALGLERFLEKGTEMGLARRTGIDLPGESPSIFPSGVDQMQARLGYRPPENEVMSLAIGQGAVTMTPLKMAQMYVALARDDGKAPAPRLAMTGEPAPITFELDLSAAQIAALRDGMRRVVGPGGTAWLSRLQGWDFMGKTGTAQNAHGTDHAWFAGIGGRAGGEPEIVAVALIYSGAHGWVASEPVANAINFYLSRKHGRPFVRHPVPRVRQKLGLPIDWEWLQSPLRRER